MIATRLSGLALCCLALLGCPLSHDEPEPYKCYDDKDCFAGEFCGPKGRISTEPGKCERSATDGGAKDRRVIDRQAPRDVSSESTGDHRLPDTGGQ